MDTLMLDVLKDVIWTAGNARRPIRIRAGGTKDWYGESPAIHRTDDTLVDLSGYTGIVAYEPSELVLTARAGTPLVDIETALATQGQMLAFEPPHCGAIAQWWRTHGGMPARSKYAPAATLGGCVASGLSGPRRASAGACRDFVLGAKLMSARGEVLTFGGQVMKNVAGFDVSRVLAGSLGVLGVILEVSVKVLPKPPCERTLRLSMTQAEALDRLNTWSGRPIPLSASVWRARDAQAAGAASPGWLDVRLSGAEAAVRAASALIGGDAVEATAAQALWTSVREQTAAFFDSVQPIWRISVPSDTPSSAFDAIVRDELIEWQGALRWWATAASPEQVRAAVARLGGHATLWRPAPGAPRAAPTFAPLDRVTLGIHQRLKAEFDPAGVFNRGRLHPDL